MIYPEPGVPPFPFTWGYGTSALAKLRNRLAYRLLTRIARPLLAAVNRHRVRIGKWPYGEVFAALGLGRRASGGGEDNYGRPNE